MPCMHVTVRIGMIVQSSKVNSNVDMHSLVHCKKRRVTLTSSGYLRCIHVMLVTSQTTTTVPTLTIFNLGIVVNKHPKVSSLSHINALTW